MGTHVNGAEEVGAYRWCSICDATCSESTNYNHGLVVALFSMNWLWLAEVVRARSAPEPPMIPCVLIAEFISDCSV